MNDERSDSPRHPIRVVARRTGLTPAVLRAWEKRYGVVVPLHGQTAVARNRLRRRLREILRGQYLSTIGPFDFIVRAHAAAYRAKFHELADDIGIWVRSLTD